MKTASDSSNLVEFWLNNPNALLDQKYIRDVWPDDSMTFERKLNAITRTIMVMTLVGAVLIRRRTTAIMASGVLATASLAFLHYMKNPSGQDREGFMNMGKKLEGAISASSSSQAQSQDEGVEKQGVGVGKAGGMVRRPREGVYASNPFRNVMVPDYGTPAIEQPMIEDDEYEEVYDTVKRNTVDEFHNEDEIESEEVHSKLFQSLGDSYVFENSMRNYATNPSRTVGGNQDEFANYCYGNMCSMKEQGIHPA